MRATWLLAMCWCAAAQVTIRTSTRLVNVDVLVTDRRTGVRVDSLKRDDFEVRDGGALVNITHYSSGGERERPFALVLLIELDNAIHPVLPNLKDKLERALRRLQPADRVAVILFDPHTFQMAQELTADRGEVLNALDRATGFRQQSAARQYSKFEALPNALLAGATHVRERLSGARCALVVIGSDFNVVSGKVVRSVAEHLLAGAASVSGLLKSDGQTNAAKFMVRAMTLPSMGSARADDTEYFSRQTGGEIAKVRNEDYAEALERVIGNTAHRYSLAFVPRTDADGKLHPLTVRVKAQGRRLQVIARRGYIDAH
ncbi:MAG: hypothetical protein JWP63_4139 [Candidatus Solibacter sp.]|nr:hypothetical protein [Candidatus Solibacter sp.]